MDARHRALLGEEASPLLLDFLRDQGFASLVGMRRAWPSPRHAAAARYASDEDLRFAARLDRLGLLMPSLDALANDGPGRPGAPANLKRASPGRGRVRRAGECDAGGPGSGALRRRPPVARRNDRRHPPPRRPRDGRREGKS